VKLLIFLESIFLFIICILVNSAPPPSPAKATTPSKTIAYFCPKIILAYRHKLCCQSRRNSHFSRQRRKSVFCRSDSGRDRQKTLSDSYLHTLRNIIVKVHNDGCSCSVADAQRHCRSSSWSNCRKPHRRRDIWDKTN